VKRTPRAAEARWRVPEGLQTYQELLKTAREPSGPQQGESQPGKALNYGPTAIEALRALPTFSVTASLTSSCPS